MKQTEESTLHRGHWLSFALLDCSHKALFSLSTAFLLINLLFLFSQNLRIPFIRLEISINLLLHIRQTDYIRGYFEFAIPSVILAACICMLLHISSDRRLTKQILRSVAGIVLLFGPLAFWILYYQLVGWSFGWPYRGAPVELALAVLCLILYLSGNWPVPRGAGILLLAAHYGFWYWTPSTNPMLAGFTGPIAPVLGFCAALAWGAYRARLRQDEAMS